MTQNPMLFEFSIVASGVDQTAADYESRFYDHGCEDALVSFQKGRTIVDFGREALSIEDAIASAVDDVRRAGATVERVEPDPLVNLAEIAKRSDSTRAAITNYAQGKRQCVQPFPSPVARVTTSSPLYDWGQVSHWMCVSGLIAREIAIEARAVHEANQLVACGATIQAELSRRMAAYRATIG